MKILVDVFGGFGNQLFQVAFALHLKRKNYNPILYTFSSKKSIGHNVFFIDETHFGLRKLSEFQEKKINKIKSYSYLDKKLFHIVNEEEITSIKKGDWTKEDKSNFSTISFNGYWQDRMFVDENIDDIKKGLLQFNSFQKSIEIKKKIGSTVLHVRRGDHAQYLPLQYYLDSISRASERISNFHYEIITDDYEWVKSKKEFASAEKIHFPNKSDNVMQNTIKDFSKMIEFENFIISNSTYSWWAARLGQNNDSKIFYPWPYWEGKDLDLFYKKWIRINR